MHPTDYSYCSSELKLTIHIASSLLHFIYSVTLDYLGIVVFRLSTRAPWVGTANLSSHWGPLYNPFGYYLTTIDCRTSTSGRTLIGCEYHWIVKRVGPQTAIPSLVPYSSPSILNSEEHWITLLLQFYFKELIRTTSDLFYKYKVTISNHQICERYFYTFFS